MSICEDIIRSAYRRSGVGAAGVALSSIQMDVGMDLLRGMYQSWFNGGMFGRVTDYYLASGNYIASEGQRIFKANGASIITIHASLSDADTGMTRAPLDGSAIAVVDPNTNIPALWIYNAIYAAWQNIQGLAPADMAPLSNQFEEPVKNLLGAIIADENGYPLTPALAKNASLGKMAIAGRFLNQRKPVEVDFF